MLLYWKHVKEKKTAQINNKSPPVAERWQRGTGRDESSPAARSAAVVRQAGDVCAGHG